MDLVAPTPVVALEGISKRFGSTQALSDVSIDIHGGEVHALVGENGAGKSTLVKVMSGVVQPDDGEIRLDGRPVEFGGPATASRAGIHLVHQELALLPFRTIVENVFLGQEQRGRVGLAWRAMALEATEALARLGLEVDPHIRVAELSTANQQLVEISRALVHRSRLIVFDEPTAALPPSDAERLFSVIRQLTGEGAAVIYISHRLDEVMELADMVTVLKDGKRVVTSQISELSTDKMIKLMVGREIEDLFPPRPGEQHGPPALEVEDVVDPPGVVAASLTVRAGEVVGLYGLEGHGQDELLSCLAGARIPVRGTLKLHGEPHPWKSTAGMIAEGVGFVPEDRKSEGLLLALSGRENISLPILKKLTRAAGIVSSRLEAASARSAADAAGVRGDLEVPAGNLSGGNQQKLILARWIAAESSVLLLNQPTRGVDVGSKSEIYALIRHTCQARSSAALVVSREILELQGMCDRILVMSHGRIVAEHPPTASEETILGSAVKMSA